MFQRDYILRMIEQMAYFIHTVLGLKQAGHYQEAMVTVNHALEGMIGTDVSGSDALAAEEIAGRVRFLLSEYTDPEATGRHLVIIATLFREAGDLLTFQGEAAQADRCRIKALQLYLISAVDEAHASDEAARSVDPLVALLDSYEFPESTKDRLWRFYERVGQYAKAEDWLFELLEAAPDSASRHAIADEAAGFFDRLASLDDDQLRFASFSRDEIDAGREHVESMRFA
jgi:tetratricopeptide (TPR) repeat protein